MIWILFVPLVCGFLLDNPSNVGNQTATVVKFLTVAEFLDEKKLQDQETERLRHDTDRLRHDMDRTLAVLTSQIQQKLAEFENKLPNNGTDAKYNLLKQKYSLLEQKYYTLEQQNIVLQSKYNALENSLRAVENDTIATKTEVSTLRHLQAIKPLEDIHALQQAVQSVTAQTQSLSLNEQARRQDFLALYNITVDSKQELSSLKTYTYSAVQELGQNQTIVKKNIEQIQTNHSRALHLLDQKLKETKESENRSLGLLQKQIETNSEKVAMTSYLRSGSKDVNSGEIIKFDNVKYSYGINNTQSYINTGKFICEKPGLYLLSASITSHTNGANYYILLNGNDISLTYIASHDYNWYHTGTVVVVVELNVGDNVWVQSAGSWYMYGGIWSKFAIVKIK